MWSSSLGTDSQGGESTVNLLSSEHATTLHCVEEPATPRGTLSEGMKHEAHGWGDGNSPVGCFRLELLYGSVEYHAREVKSTLTSVHPLQLTPCTYKLTVVHVAGNWLC